MSFLKSVLVVFSGTLGAQIITFAISPIITRLYSPSEIGILGVFSSITSMLIPIIALTLPLAIVMPKSEKSVRAIVQLSVIIATTLSVVSLSVVYVYVYIYGGSWIFLLIPVCLLVGAIQQITEQYAIRVECFKIIASTALVQSLFLNTSKVLVGVSYPSGDALVIISCMGYILSVLILICFFRSMFLDKKFWAIKVNHLKLVFCKYYDFSLYRAPQILLSGLSQSAPIFILASGFSTQAAGYYSLAKTVMMIPCGIVSKSFGDVYFQRIVKEHNKGACISKTFFLSTLALGFISVIPLSIIYTYGSDIFMIIFGSEWETAGVYSKYLSIWVCALFINVPAVKVLPILKMQGLHLLITCGGTIFRCSVLIFAIYFSLSDMDAVFYYSIASALINLLIISLVAFKLMTIKKSRELQKI
ncbi:lipopolysaccharide biosynthesis protein [Vibrio campbellii]|nr:oligosaccharide flippase family protein [Vibrio campbellii]